MTDPTTTQNPASSIHTFRVNREAWSKAKLRARAEGLTVSRATAFLVAGYADGTYTPAVASRKRSPRGASANINCSVRVPEDVWGRAEARAADREMKMSPVVATLIEEYARGAHPLPKRRSVFDR